MRGSRLSMMAALMALGLASQSDYKLAQIDTTRSRNGNHRTGAAAARRAARTRRNVRARQSKRS